jgi:hypothetical protein
MPADGSTSLAALNGKGAQLDLDRVLTWRLANWEEQFKLLVKHPPLRSVVVDMHHEVAEQLLKLSNTNNRRKTENHAKNLAAEMVDGLFAVTGDTLKITRKGRLADGQHRLFACVEARASLTTHMVFGIDDAIFDLLDQGRKRTAADVLGMCGIAYPNLVAGAIAFVQKHKAPNRVSLDGGMSNLRLSPRRIKELALGRMKNIVDHVHEANRINVAFKQPPTMVLALLYLIGEHNPAVARDFAHEWAVGARVARNRNFDVFVERLQTIAHGNNGVVSRTVRWALMIQMFNYWHAHRIATPRALAWRKGLSFPALEFNAERFKAAKDDAERADTSRAAVRLRIHRILTEKMSARTNEVAIPEESVASLANTSRASVKDILAEMCRDKTIIQVREARKEGPARYQVIRPAVSA